MSVKKKHIKILQNGKILEKSEFLSIQKSGDNVNSVAIVGRELGMRGGAQP